ncbi:MAG: tetratricopeptide repeat protein [Acidobacteriota bacterium]
MNLRTALGVIVTIIVLAACSWIHLQNRELLSERLRAWPARTLSAQEEPLPPGAPDALVWELPVGHALLGTFGLGALLILLGWSVRSAKQVSKQAGVSRDRNTQRKISQSLTDGLEALLHDKPQEALTAMQQVLEHEPKHSRALLFGADALRGLGRPGEAQELRRRLLEDDPTNERALFGLADDQVALGDGQAAATTLGQLAEGTSELSRIAARRLREVELERGELDAALTAHDRHQKLRKKHGVSTREGEDEADRIRRALETRKALQDAELGRTSDAQSALKKVLSKDPGYAPARLALGQALLADGREDEALKIYQEGYERTREGAMLVAAERCFLDEPGEEGNEVERTAHALSTFRRFAQGDGPRHQAVAFLGKLYTRLEMLDDAAATFDSVRDSFPDNPTFTYYAARIAQAQGRHEEAADWFRAIVKSLAVLRLRYRCTRCEVEIDEYTDRCPGCGRFGAVTLDLGMRELHQPLPAARPVYETVGAAAGEGSDASPETTA